jgi:hypothetical protein
MGLRRAFTAAVTVVAVLVGAPSAAGKVLLVGTYHGIRGQYRTIQQAVDHAKPGDWILIGPGDYKTTSSRIQTSPNGDFPAAVLIKTPHLHLRGMNRNTVIVDGTKGGPPCNAERVYQNFGPPTPNGPAGLNGIMVWKANGVWVQNLTACNFLAGADAAGNEIWWNGGAGSGGASTVSIGGWGFLGSYLNATSTFFDTSVPAQQAEKEAAQYGIFSSNWSGGTWNQTYASNFNDSSYYIGACGQVCDQTVIHAWGEYSALGYSGSNSGGRLVVEYSQFDNNEDGFDTNSQNGDNPPPQDGACPGNRVSPITHTHSCWVFMHNYVHDNNNPNVPAAGSAAAGPVGTGMSISGGRDDTVMDNTFVRNNAWGVILVPYPDSGPPCTGGTQTGAACLYDEFGDAILDNTFTDNGGYGNPTNGDIALTNTEPDPTDCFAGNVDTGGTLTTTPSNAQQMYPTCNGQTVPPSDTNPQSAQFTLEVACDSQISLTAGAQPPCAPTDHYPRRTHVIMHPLPPARELPTMPNPCAGVPANPWCPAPRHGRKRAPAGRHRRARHGRIRLATPRMGGFDA